MGQVPAAPCFFAEGLSEGTSFHSDRPQIIP